MFDMLTEYNAFVSAYIYFPEQSNPNKITQTNLVFLPHDWAL